MYTRKLLVAIATAALLQGCDGGAAPGANVAPPPNAPPPLNNPQTAIGSIDDQLRALIVANNLTGDPSTGRNLPQISDPLAQLGK